MLEYKIKDLSNNSDPTLVDDHNASITGLKFVVFEYLFPLPFFPPVKRMSRVYCLNKTRDVGILGSRYRIFNFVTCWLGLPFGPIEMFSSNKKNKTGIDITDYIASKITLNDIRKGVLKLPVYEAAPRKLEKEMIQLFKEQFEHYKKEGLIEVAPKIVYTIVRRKHYFFIGLHGDEISRSEIIKNKLSQNFDSSTQIIFESIESNSALAKKIITEGHDAF